MRELWDYREYILYKVKADLRSEVSRYYISYLWWFLDPILNMLVFYVIFGLVFERGGPDFVPFLLIGLTTWQWFGQGVNHSSNSILSAKGIMNQVYIPKIIFPFITLVTDTFKFFLVFITLFIFLVVWGFELGAPLISLPFLLISQFFFIAFISSLCASLVPLLPDLRFLIGHILHLGFFVSGIFFSIERIPDPYKLFFTYNPMAQLIASYRTVFLHNQWPNFSIVSVIFSVSIIGYFCSALILRRMDREYPRMVE